MLRKTQLFVVGLAAFLIGFPLAERTFAQWGSIVGGIVDASIYGSEGSD